MEFYRHFTGTTYTSGVQQLAEKKSAYWIIDAISSHVVANSEFKKRCSSDPMFEDMQIWILKKKQDGAKLIAVADTVREELNAPTCEQEIEFTDFEFGEDEEIKFLLTPTVEAAIQAVVLNSSNPFLAVHPSAQGQSGTAACITLQQLQDLSSLFRKLVGNISTMSLFVLLSLLSWLLIAF